MKKHLISIYGAPLTGKTHISQKLTSLIPGAVHYAAYDTTERPFALERLQDISRVHKAVGDLLTEHDVLIVDEDPMAMTTQQAFRPDAWHRHKRGEAHTLYQARAGTEWPFGLDIRHSYVHATVSGEDGGSRLQILEERIGLRTANTVGRIAFANDVAPLLEAGDAYEEFLRTNGTPVARVVTNETYDIQDALEQLRIAPDHM